MNFLEKSRSKLVHLLFPFVERFYIVLSLVVLVAAWLIPETNGQIKVVLFWIWYIIIYIHSEGVMERDYLPLQPGNSLFYNIYRFILGVSLLFPLVVLVILLLPAQLWIKGVALGVFFIGSILQAIGDHKYRPKKPEE